MKDIFRRGLEALTGRKKITERGTPEYEAEKARARSEDVGERKKIAKSAKTRPEILYYLAADKDPEVRRAVAQNKSTPPQADVMLAQDKDVDVRMVLAKRIMDLLPNLSEDKQSQIYSYAVNTLATLARDEVLKVRIALSTTLKDHSHAPPQVAAQLAKDAEREVAEPILRFCVALSDDDLLEIIAEHPAPWVLSAIAARGDVAEPVSDAIIDTENADAGRVLIGNSGARLSVQTMEIIVQKANQIPAWQEPLVQRKELPASLAKQLAMFVDSALLRYLQKRADYDEETQSEIVNTVRRRIEFEKTVGKGNVYQNVALLEKNGKLTDDIIADALSWQEIEFVKASLAVRARAPIEAVDKIIEVNSPKGLVSLAWKAGLSMRVAMTLQRSLLKVSEKEVILARGGFDYPLPEDQMAWQLEFFGIQKAKKA